MARNIGVGCFTIFIGIVSGAMSGVMVGKITGYFTRCVPTEGLPACDWEKFAMGGALIGGITLPLLALWRLRRADRNADAPQARP